MGYAVVDTKNEVHATIEKSNGGDVNWVYIEEDSRLQQLVETALIEGLEDGRKNYLPGQRKFEELFWKMLEDAGFELSFIPSGATEAVERAAFIPATDDVEVKIMPKAILEKLPAKAKEIYEAAYKSAQADGKDEEAAAKIAIAAVKEAGYHKDEKSGQWIKMQVVRAYFTKATTDDTGAMRWNATVSKFGQDDQKDIVYESFYRSAIAAFESGERPAPVMCISHIDKGRATEDWAAGDTDTMYIDGKMPKARGVFANTPLGKTLFAAVKADIDNNVPHEDRIRISMGFYATEVEPLEGGGRGFRKGWIKHFAATRVPVVKETEIMTEKGNITTVAEDAASIVGKDLAAVLLGENGKAPEMKGLVTKANEDQVRDLLSQLMNLLTPADKEPTQAAPDASGMRKPLGNDGTNGTPPAAAEPVVTSTVADPVDALLDSFVASVKAALRSDGTRVEKFQGVQSVLDKFGEGVTELVNASTAPSVDDIALAVSNAVAPLQQELAAVKAQLGALQQQPQLPSTNLPSSMDQRVALTQAPFPVSGAGSPTQSGGVQTKSLADLAWESTDPRYG
jgi:cation transport regulator ChaB